MQAWESANNLIFFSEKLNIETKTIGLKDSRRFFFYKTILQNFT